MNPDDVQTIRAELRDRFGPAPTPVEDLLLAVEIRAQTGHLRGMVRSIAHEGSEILVRLRDVHWLDRDVIRRALPRATVGHLQIRLSALGDADWRGDLKRLIEEFARMSAAAAPAAATA